MPQFAANLSMLWNELPFLDRFDAAAKAGFKAVEFLFPYDFKAEDIAERLRTQWPTLKPDLDGKIHVIVGTADTFYLDGAAHRLKDTLDAVGAKADIRFIPDRTHFDLYAEDGDPMALLVRIGREMYAAARPGAKWTPAPATASK